MKYLFSAVFALSILSCPALSLAQQGGPPVTPVVVHSVQTDDFTDRVEAIGTLRANESVTLTSKVTETVTAVNFEDGQRVSKGDILVEMTSREQKALLDQQKALVSEASGLTGEVPKLLKGEVLAV